MKKYVCMLALLACGISAAQVHAADPLPPPNFFAAAVTTEVHRQLVGGEATAYAMVNCSGITSSEGEYSPEALNEKIFLDELSKLAAEPPARLKLVYRYVLPDEPPKPVRQALESRLFDLAREAGFEIIRTSKMHTSVDWQSQYAPLAEIEGAGAATEPVISNQWILAYPARTKLSKLIVGDVDCVVELRRPVDGRQHDLRGELRVAIVRSVQSMGLSPLEKDTLKFQVSSTTAGEPLVEKLFDASLPPKVGAARLAANLADPFGDPADPFAAAPRAYKPSPAMEIAFELGFGEITYSHSFGGGAPELLIGKPAPDFTLPSLDGADVRLQDHIAGRPALITFWAVGCGPCCVEAPHLTKLHHELGDELAILAVNGFDESRAVVAEFVESANLDHPMVLDGGTVADELYKVGAYPTTFYVDAHGIVEDYEVGFDSPELLKQKVRAMLVPTAEPPTRDSD